MVEYRVVKKGKKAYAIVLIILYIVSFILVNIGFYTPEWQTSYDNDSNRICNEVGLVSGDCRYPYNGIDRPLGLTFYTMTTAICLLYMSFFLLVVGVIFNWLENPIFMSFSSIVAGLLYPIAAILTFLASATNLCVNAGTCYAAIITCTGGCLMMICTEMLGMYRKVFRKTTTDSDSSENDIADFVSQSAELFTSVLDF